MVFLFILFLLNEFASWAGEPFAISRTEYQCQAPLKLNDFRTHLEQGHGHRAIRWNLTALDPYADMRLRLVQISSETVSPSAVLRMPPNGYGSFEVPLRAMTMERRWLETLRGTDAVELLSPAQQLTLWINETYHLFTTRPEGLREVPRGDPFFGVFENGAYVFSGEKIAFIVSKDQKFLTSCPKVLNGKVGMTARDLSKEIIRFTHDNRVRKFFSCEAMLARR